MKKNYATETDVITIPDPLFHRGDEITAPATLNFPYIVESVAWNDWEHSWEYEVTRAGSWVDEKSYLFEKEMRLVSRDIHTKFSNSAIVNGKKIILQKD